jgi:hypothetical protein
MRAFVLLTLSVLLLTSSAHAQAKRVAQERAAKKACLVGDTSKGVDILADLFIDTNDATYIYNQGRCYEQNHMYENAVARFREYLVKAGRATPEEKADAEKHIATCQAYLAEAEAAKAAATPSATTQDAAPVQTGPSVAAQPVAQPVALPIGQPVTVAPGPTAVPPSARPHNRRTPGTVWLALGGGTGGAYHGLQAVDSGSKQANSKVPVPVAAGFASASLFQLEPELGIQLSELFAISVLFRYQFAPADDTGYVPGPDERALLTSAFAGFLRGELSFLNLANFRSYLSLGAGLGRSFLAVVAKDCDMTSCPLNHSDTLHGGMFGLMGGLGFAYHLTRNLGMYLDVKEIVTFRTILALTEFNVGFSFAINP